VQCIIAEGVSQLQDWEAGVGCGTRLVVEFECNMGFRKAHDASSVGKLLLEQLFDVL